MGGVIWYRFVRYSGTDWSATLVPIGAMRWYRFIRYSGTDSPILSNFPTVRYKVLCPLVFTY